MIAKKIALLTLLICVSFSFSFNQATNDNIPSKVEKRFYKDHKNSSQAKFEVTDLGNVKVSYFNEKMREAWVYYTPEGKMLEDVIRVPLSEISPQIIEDLKSRQKSIDTRYNKETIVSSYAKIIVNKDGVNRYYIEFKDALKTASMEYSLEGKFIGIVLDDEVY